MIDIWASIKSFRPKDGGDDDAPPATWCDYAADHSMRLPAMQKTTQTALKKRSSADAALVVTATDAQKSSLPTNSLAAC